MGMGFFFGALCYFFSPVVPPCIDEDLLQETRDFVDEVGFGHEALSRLVFIGYSSPDPERKVVGRFYTRDMWGRRIRVYIQLSKELPPYEFARESILLHEIGHAIYGLDHHEAEGAIIMSEYLPNLSTKEDFLKARQQLVSYIQSKSNR